METKRIIIVGAGLVGSMLAIYLRQRGHQVVVYERRPDLRKTDISAGKSINLALSSRGLRPLAEIGLEDDIQRMIIPMSGRMMHDESGNLNYQPYGKQNQAINSISRGGLNSLLLTKAESEGVQIHFEHQCEDVDLLNNQLIFDFNGQNITTNADYIFGTDGAFSVIRQTMESANDFVGSKDFVAHGYKELSFPPTKTEDFALEKHALHIWPRGNFMLIALPNLDASFTVTLFLPFEGPVSFEKLSTAEEVEVFFSTYFSDALALIPNLAEEFKDNPVGSMVTVRSYPWVNHNTTLLGDAAHAIVPFYGQGMNCGFEDCFVLNKLLDEYNEDWNLVLEQFQLRRKPDADAIADLALQNFIEMRDKVGDALFLVRKKIEAKLHTHYPDKWIPQYTMVTFSPDIRYSEAMQQGNVQKSIMDKVMQKKDIITEWDDLNLAVIISQLP
jgi:kynurenine 3-monooxygenase